VGLTFHLILTKRYISLSLSFCLSLSLSLSLSVFTWRHQTCFICRYRNILYCDTNNWRSDVRPWFSCSNEPVLLTDLFPSYNEVAILYFPDLEEVSRQVWPKICQVSLILSNRSDSHVWRTWVKARSWLSCDHPAVFSLIPSKRSNRGLPTIKWLRQ